MLFSCPCPHKGQLRSAGGQINQKTARREGEKSDWKRGGKKEGAGQEQSYWAVKRSMKTKGAAALYSSHHLVPGVSPVWPWQGTLELCRALPPSTLNLHWQPGLYSDRCTLLQPLCGKHGELLKKHHQHGRNTLGNACTDFRCCEIIPCSLN